MGWWADLRSWPEEWETESVGDAAGWSSSKVQEPEGGAADTSATWRGLNVRVREQLWVLLTPFPALVGGGFGSTEQPSVKCVPSVDSHSSPLWVCHFLTT